ncbi:MAG: alpha-ketoacid dehydrogenase subunit beta [Anaerolineae bacterium]|nr:alpha-ketoacid dehydrogenase subunit beta [Anaerolineae bacterium]
MAEMTYADAIRAGLREEMRRDERVYILGQDVRNTSHASLVMGDLWKEFGDERVVDTPLSETVMAGSCVGTAIAGFRPIVEIMFADFCFVCMDEIVQKMGKWRYEHGAQSGMKLPIVVMAPIGGYFCGGAEHSGTPLAYFMHSPGLKIAVPSGPYDAKGLIKTAIRDDNPVMFLEHKLLIYNPGLREEIPDEEYLIPLGVADVKREGDDVTVVAIGLMVQHALAVAEKLAKEGVSVEVIDPRTLEPFDIETIVASVRKTGRVVLVDEGMTRCGVPAEIGMQIQEQAFDALKAPIRRVGAANVPIPASRPLENAVLPQPEWIAQAIRDVLL